MSIFEYDEEKHLKNEREAGYQKGHEEGKQEGIQEGHEAGLQEGHKAGLQEGHKTGLQEGKSQVNTLILKLIETGQKDKIEKAVTDREYQEELFKDFNL